MSMLPMITFALIGAISPGPVNIIAASSGANFGFRRTLAHVFGASIAYSSIVLVVGLGLNFWLILFPQLAEIVQYVGAVFLLYLAYKIASARPETSRIEVTRQPPSFVEGVLAQGLNPKAWLVAMSGVSLFVSNQAAATLYLALFCVISFTVCMLGISTWAAIGHSIRGLLSTPKRQIGFNVLMGLLLGGTVVSMLMTN